MTVSLFSIPQLAASDDRHIITESKTTVAAIAAAIIFGINQEQIACLFWFPPFQMSIRARG